MEISGYQAQSNTNVKYAKPAPPIGEKPSDTEVAAENTTNAISAVGGVDSDNKASMGGLNSPAIDVKLSEQEPERVRHQGQNFMAENAEAVIELRPEIENFTI